MSTSALLADFRTVSTLAWDTAFWAGGVVGRLSKEIRDPSSEIDCRTVDSDASDFASALVSGLDGSMMVGMVEAAVIGRAIEEVSSAVVCPSSASSVTLSSFLRREEPLDEQLDGAAVCREQAAARAASLRSSAVAMGRIVSWENFSAMAVK